MRLGSQTLCKVKLNMLEKGGKLETSAIYFPIYKHFDFLGQFHKGTETLFSTEGGA